MAEVQPGDLLPTVYVPTPECGHCYSALVDDGDGYQCEKCGLCWAYNSMDEPAEYLDDEAEPCGHKGRDRVEVPTEVGVALYREYPCPLPSGHASEHLHEFESIGGEK
ncbi:hypothetical protein QDA08_gp88 [Microbacterium phage NoodlelyBoi]|uniref:Uncharacterized protein n=1 Tax=Microbacterium phage NoodlelyBoi TaxID=2813165 RepID=A0A899IR14_9CAUD|nr:hypothetical protein QDA08_gp88 [Microbacterium phage NoodlelyBoi]QSM01282.1 hypothetical protein SEA_NOODLELYBOI_88 [Microbacterium phage NoodlelyBoi]